MCATALTGSAVPRAPVAARACARQAARSTVPRPAATFCRPAGPASCRQVAARSGVQELGWIISEAAKAGTVESPAWVLPVAAAVIAIVGGGSAILLKPGDDAAKEMQARDSRKWNKKE
eukprot:CAMPEP_0117662544 /NCGR_PEP_ID=MMETSP0804-20121206/8108_1 /TAXON_ID=1074897 /ORGANISM="Tetraselmis astigmatica, Strain CCMP880" /LENGTH=118 /DNA_ID=CAMNT_0005469447 /DNA_START=113 /DNA_END=469 /DNA_ORIENTATION=+